ncbi:T9SS type A sorting domain-containing protein [Candidatus Poribacteria bacterium]|nr:T9SS type A sorting domain-containing protein [Candidatus Poribacteria bacterium]
MVGRAGDPGDIEITGGQAFIVTAQRAATVTISGNAWANGSGTAAAPPVTRKGVEVGDTTPVLGLRGSIVDDGTGLNTDGFRVTVKNLSTGRAVAAVTTPDEAGYRSTAVDIETGRAATVGDILEISAQSPNPFIGVEPFRYAVTAEDVKQSLIQLPELVAYEIPAETKLLSNYPNPFNPETWIPYRLAEDAFVTLTIYDLNGQIVRTINVGHQTAAVYENRSKAIYWDGRNELGEQVASGVYFYHLAAGDYFATRKMVILK